MAHCEHRTSDGHCSHLIMADRGKVSGTTQCPFPEATTRACVLNGKLEVGFGQVNMIMRDENYLERAPLKTKQVQFKHFVN